MKKLSIFVCICLLAACATLLCGCCTQEELNIETQSTLSLAVGTSQKVSYSVNPATAVVRFESDNTDVVKTEGNMLVAVSAGSATITFYAQNKGKSATATCIVTVFDNTPPQDEQPNHPEENDNPPVNPNIDDNKDNQNEPEDNNPNQPEDNNPNEPNNDSNTDEEHFVNFNLTNTNGKFDSESKTLTVKQNQLSFFKVNFDKNIANFNKISDKYSLICEDLDISLIDKGYAWTFVASANCTIKIMFENTIIGIINVVVE